jgi:hypothetical protein
MTQIFETYLLALAKTYAGGEGTEHSGRSALETMLKAVAAAGDPKLQVQHEMGREGDKGAPDFRVMKAGQIIGYVENKKIGEKLSAILKTEQIKKYRALSENLILTNYLDFIWIEGDTIHPTASLAHEADIEFGKAKLKPENAAAVEKLLTGFFSTPPVGIGRVQKLAIALAVRSQMLRDFLGEELVRQEKEHKEGRLFGLFAVFKQQVFHELTLREFADAFAQTLSYGLFLAKLNAETQTITLDNARQFVPGAFRLIRELVSFLDDLKLPEYRNIRWVVVEILSIVNGLDIAAIHEDLAFKNRKPITRKMKAQDEEEWRLFSRDPFVYFYEDFLGKYDKDMKKSRGVYYTPPPIVNFIVRAVDDILKDKFEIPDGLADHKRVTVLDFACGTGTFLLEVFQRIFENIGGPKAGKADKVVREHMLENIYGFEYLIAPYTIAHLKLSQFLKEQGHPLADNERLQVFLTNTLEPIEPQATLLLPAVTAEVKAAQEVKEKPILVITGNPPYSGHSKNKGKWITAAIDAYKKVDGKPLGEKNPKWLQDDYVKFIRFAQMKMDAVEKGIVGIITNHSWLDNPTFRGMRQSLQSTFDQIWILDLHGSTKPKEIVPEGLENENVFDIQKGVAVAIFIKKPGLNKGNWFSEFWGSRIDKYRAAAEAEIDKIVWKEVPHFEPYYMFRPLDWTGWEKYKQGWQVADSLSPEDGKLQIFARNVLGFQTHRDHFAIGFSTTEMTARARDMISTALTDADIKERYEISNNRDWNLKDARASLRQISDWKRNLIRCAWRPFDTRICYFGNEFMDYPRRELIDHVAWKKNVQLLIPRQIGSSTWRHAFVADDVAESCCISDASREGNYNFPLWIYGTTEIPTENLSPAFREFLDARYDHHYTPEEILGYIYAVLHAPSYRSRYAAFLRLDFPRIPFAEAKLDFDALSELGQALVEVHLLKKPKPGKLAVYHGTGGHEVEAVRYSQQEEAIWISKTRCFRPVPEPVWNFHIGGYRVLDKYLKSRKGRKLVLAEIDHVTAVANVLAFTIGQMQAIDTAYLAAFHGRG